MTIRILRAILFTGYYLGMLVMANLRVALEIITPRNVMKPAIVGFDLDLKSDFGIFMLVNLITMTPGTLSLDLSKDKKTLFVHVMFAGDIPKVKDELKDLETRIRKIIEP